MYDLIKNTCDDIIIPEDTFYNRYLTPTIDFSLRELTNRIEYLWLHTYAHKSFNIYNFILHDTYFIYSFLDKWIM